MRFAARLLSTACCFSVCCFPNHCQAQNRYPSVAEIFEKYDRDRDNSLTSEEVADSRYERQFPRWDQDGDGKVVSTDVVKFRRRFGIAADGSMLKEREPFGVPKFEDLPRVDRDHPPSRQAAQQSAYILKTEVHPSAGVQYVILTDHTSSGYLGPLQRLAKHRRARMIKVDDLAKLHERRKEAARVREQLVDARYVAIAMRKESFRENTLLGMWELLSTIDEDPQIDVWPGLLLASNETSFARLIDRSIGFRSLTSSELTPLAVSQVQRASETRSLQKAAILRNVFAEAGVKTPIVAIYGRQAENAPRLSGEQIWNLTTSGHGKFITTFPAPVASALDRASLWILHGHGVPGMACSIDIEGLPKSIEGKIVLSGSCFSAVPWESDLPRLREAPGGYHVQQREAFAIRAIDQGAVIAFGHQRLSSGFPHLYPVLEAWTKGQTLGQAYQQLLNGLIDLQQSRPGDFVITDSQKEQRRIPQNQLLYVLIGDPALQPMERLN